MRIVLKMKGSDMKRNIILLMSVLLVSSLASASLKGEWLLDETDGTTATDTSGQDNDGTLSGALAFDGSGVLTFNGGDDRVNIPAPDTSGAWNGDGLYWSTDEEFMIVWEVDMMCSHTPDVKEVVMMFGDTDAAYPHKQGNKALILNTDGTLSVGGVNIYITGAGALSDQKTTATVNDGAWHTIKAVWDVTSGSDVVQIWIDGSKDLENADFNVNTWLADPYISGWGAPGMILGYNRKTSAADKWHVFTGSLDNVRIYSSVAEAHSPYPADGATDVELDVTLTWETGDDPDVLLGENPAIKAHYLYGDFYNDASDPNLNYLGEFVVGVDDNSYTVADMNTLTTYQWYIEEAVDDGMGGYYGPGDPNNNIVGPIWTFTTLDPLPSIVTQPISMTKTAGANAVFTIEGGTSVKNYEWYKVVDAGDDTLLLEGSGAVALTLSSITVADEGAYYCIVYNQEGLSLESDHAWLWTERLMGHWTFDGTLANEEDGFAGVYVDPNELAPAPDPSGAYAAGRVGQAFQFSADDDLRVEIENSEGFFNFCSQGFTVAGWVWFDAIEDDSSQIFIAKNEYIETYDDGGTLMSTDYDGWFTGLNNSGNLAFYACEDESYGFNIIYNYGLNVSEPAISAGQWYYVVSRYAPDSLNGMSIFVNGHLAGSTILAPDAIDATTTPLTFGDACYGLTPFDGKLDEVKIWSYALGDRDVLQEYVDVTGERECYENPALDLTGPEGEPDCIVNLYDFAEFARYWLDDDIVYPEP